MRRLMRRASTAGAAPPATDFGFDQVIESAFAVVEKVCANVKRWYPGDQRERWVGSGLLVAENHFRRVKGYQLIPQFTPGIRHFHAA